MKDEYTPTTEDVLAHWGRTHTEVGVRALNRWLASVKAAAWDEAISEAAEQGTIQTPPNPYKEMP